MKKTFTSNRNLYTLGTLYEFSDDKENWEPWVLEDIHPNEAAKYRVMHNTGFKYIRECKILLGTIEPVKIPLINNHIYSFNIKDIEGTFIGFYGERDCAFYSAKLPPLPHSAKLPTRMEANHKGRIAYVDRATNIECLTIL